MIPPPSVPVLCTVYVPKGVPWLGNVMYFTCTLFSAVLSRVFASRGNVGMCSRQTFVHFAWASFLVLRIVSFCSRSFKASHILISGDGLVTLSGLSHLHSLVKHGQRHRAVFDFPQFSTSVQPWLSPELLRQVRCGCGIGLSVRLTCLWVWLGDSCVLVFWRTAATRPFLFSRLC